MRPTAAVASSGSMYVVVHRHSTLISTDITGWPVPAARHRHYQPVDTATNETIIDFNKAYKYVHRSSMLLGLLSHPWDRALSRSLARDSPPCVFTPYATCPLPLPENRLKIRIEAGEKVYGDH